ncbi:MAG: hypothetical protein IJ125_04625 [Atopobiaceae bacterium]|nr:hypothetical protein [Atopobiaceae bacterium]
MTDPLGLSSNSLRESDRFQLGVPALICRWRLSAQTLPLQNRHLRALACRHVNGKAVSKNLIAWVKQNLEWTLAAGSVEHPDGVLMLIIDESGQAAMTVGPYQELERPYVARLAQRATSALEEAAATGIAPETFCVYSNNKLILGIADNRRQSGSCSLITGLAESIGIPVAFDEGLAEKFVAGPRKLNDANLADSEVFLVSDEHGVVEARDGGGKRAQKFVGAYKKLFDRAAKRKNKLRAAQE